MEKMYVLRRYIIDQHIYVICTMRSTRVHSAFGGLQEMLLESAMIIVGCGQFHRKLFEEEGGIIFPLICIHCVGQLIS